MEDARFASKSTEYIEQTYWWRKNVSAC